MVNMGLLMPIKHRFNCKRWGTKIRTFIGRGIKKYQSLGTRHSKGSPNKPGILVTTAMKIRKTTKENKKRKYQTFTIGGSKGGARDASPSRSNFFYFHAVLAKILPNRSNRFSLPPRGLTPPSRKSWIRHCSAYYNQNSSANFHFRLDLSHFWVFYLLKKRDWAPHGQRMVLRILLELLIHRDLSLQPFLFVCVSALW